MPGLLEDCRELFDTDDLYGVLDISKKASQNEVKRAYHKLSLKVHPDRVDRADKAEATRKFQTLGKVYSILSDKEKRAVYDDSGEIDEENDLTQDRDWYDYWRLLFAKISVKDIEDFEKKYKGSEEEVNDLKAAYIDYKGDMDLIMENVLCASIEDEPRFREILEQAIKDKEVPSYKKFTAEKAGKKKERQKKASQEAAEAEEMKSELGLGDGADSLKAMIAQRQSNREGQMDDFFSQLEAKYAQPQKKKSKKGK